MKPENVRVGHTYRVHIPTRDSRTRYLAAALSGEHADLGTLGLAISHDNDFDLTITEIGARLRDEPAVTGLRVVDTSRVAIPVPFEIAEALGLSASTPYVVDGVLRDSITDEPVRLPDAHTVTILTRWLVRPEPGVS